MAKIHIHKAIDEVDADDIWLEAYAGMYPSRQYYDEESIGKCKWYIMVNECQQDGWTFFTVNPNYKYIEVKELLTKRGIEFHNYFDEFLIKNKKDAIMIMLKYG